MDASKLDVMAAKMRVVNVPLFYVTYSFPSPLSIEEFETLSSENQAFLPLFFVLSFNIMKLSFKFVLVALALTKKVNADTLAARKLAAESQQAVLNRIDNDGGFGMKDPFIPTPAHILPEKKPFHIDELINYCQRFVNGSGNGYYRRSSCPALNSLSNRGYINRSGRNITYRELAHAVRRVWNFGDDNV